MYKNITITLGGREFSGVELNGVKLLNATPHPIKFVDGDSLVELPTSGLVVSAKAETIDAGEFGGAKLVKTRFNGDNEMAALLDEAKDHGIIVVGSIIAVNAYPGKVYGLVPAPGFERVPPAEKRFLADTFNVA